MLTAIFLQLARSGQLLLSLPLLLAALAGIALLRYPWVGFGLLVASVPVQRLGAEGGGLPATLTQLVFPLALAGLLIGILLAGVPLRGHIVLLPAFALYAVMLVSALTAEDTAPALAELGRWGIALVALWMALQFVAGASRRRLGGFVALLALGGVFEASLGVVQSVLGFGPFELESGVSRAYGTFGRPNSYAGYLEMTLFPALWLGVWYLGSTRSRWQDYVAVRLSGMPASRGKRRAVLRATAASILLSASAVLISSGIIASLSRGAWFGVIVGLAVTALLYGPLTRAGVVVAALAIVALLFGSQTGVLPEDFRERVEESADQIRPINPSTVPITDENFAAAERLAHWQAGWGMFSDHPATGVGLGNFNVRFEEYAVREGFRTSQGHAHNYYIHTLSETGLPGLLAYLTLLATVVFLALRVLLAPATGDGFARALVLGALGAVVAVATHNIFENLHVLNLGIIISLHWALIIAGHERWWSEQSAIA
jgi:O-antigen ligase